MAFTENLVKLLIRNVVELAFSRIGRFWEDFAFYPI